MRAPFLANSFLLLLFLKRNSKSRHQPFWAASFFQMLALVCHKFQAVVKEGSVFSLRRCFGFSLTSNILGASLECFAF